MDAVAAFLNLDLDRDIYIELPKGYKQPRKIALLKKGLYGLK